MWCPGFTWWALLWQLWKCLVAQALDAVDSFRMTPERGVSSVLGHSACVSGRATSGLYQVNLPVRADASAIFVSVDNATVGAARSVDIAS